ncbi:DUF202 domain-containing protein [Microbacterium sp. W1N]|uniref:DUF202 domain-containing protein n=1 Tax=Microbacterium festucae TaxID=2977531 RepID=UPI0021C1C70B|nr:DUF202 domain-containing protein [Microbacterium festucae]MCT9821251.1 DUF202 domain-containing protein [Microbacterium festucae]
MSALFDPGLQPERTELAWRRTALALGVGAIVSMRMLPLAFGDPWWIVVGMVGLLVAAAMWLGARRRYRVGTRLLLNDGDRARMPGAGLLALTAAVAGGAAALGVAVVVVSAVRG